MYSLKSNKATLETTTQKKIHCKRKRFTFYKRWVNKFYVVYDYTIGTAGEVQGQSWISTVCSNGLNMHSLRVFCVSGGQTVWIIW